MKMEVDDLDGDIRRVQLDGRLDIAGAEAIDLKLSTLCGSATKVLVSLKDVEFLASIGIRSLVLNAKTMQRRGGRFVLSQPKPVIEKVLTTTGIDQVIPIFGDESDAIRALGN